MELERGQVERGQVELERGQKTGVVREGTEDRWRLRGDSGAREGIVLERGQVELERGHMALESGTCGVREGTCGAREWS